jgi:hypothetical protein
MVKLVLLVNPSACCSRTSNQHDTYLLQCLDLKSKPFLAPISFSHLKKSACRSVIQHPAASKAMQHCPMTLNQVCKQPINVKHNKIGGILPLELFKISSLQVHVLSMWYLVRDVCSIDDTVVLCTVLGCCVTVSKFVLSSMRTVDSVHFTVLLSSYSCG